MRGGEMNKTEIIILLALFGFISCLQAAYYSNKSATYKRMLDDPHHCVSVCVEEFEKMGC